MRWVGSDLGLGVIDRLSADPSIKLGVMESSDVGISVDPKLPGWCVFTKGATIPSKSMWELYNSIARHLLEVPIPTGPVESMQPSPVSPGDTEPQRAAYWIGSTARRLELPTRIVFILLTLWSASQFAFLIFVFASSGLPPTSAASS